jgi:hypothetical protein
VLQVPKHDPLPPAAMIAAATTRLGVVATMSTMAYPPFMLARLASTIDHIRAAGSAGTSSPAARTPPSGEPSTGQSCLGIGAMFEMLGIERAWYSSALRAHLTRTLPFGLLIMLAVFNRFNPAYEEASRDLGAQGRQTIRYVVVPIIAPSLLGVALFGFTLSYDEIARTSQSVGALNTLPLELEAMQTNATTPVIYALGAMTTGLSFLVIAVCLLALVAVRPRRERFGSDAGKAV